MRLRPAFCALALAVTLGACAASDTGDTGDGDASADHDAAPADAEPIDDADGDGIPDAVEDAPDFDRDGDGTPDYLDEDSDDDGVRDYYEGANDYDSDGAPNFRDEDADGDCVPDELEGGEPPRDFDGDTRWDFLDRDSDDDGIADGAEDADCDGTVDDGETSATDGDTDDDGVTDLVEETAGTDPNNPEDNPQAEGDFVFIEPYQAPQTPTADDLDFATDLIKVDVYLLIDRSISMAAEIADIRDSLATAIDTVQCPPQGDGDLDTCVPDLWGGAGTIGYASNEPYFNRIDMQPDPLFTAIPETTLNTTPTLDATTFSMWSALTGLGSAAAPQCTLAEVLPRASCAGSAAATAGYGTFGYPCFRDGAMPVIVVATDEAPRTGSDTLECPAWAVTTRNAFDDRGAKLMGVICASPNATTRDDLEKMAEYTGAIDTNNNDAPLVFDGADANAAEAVAGGLATLAAGVPLDLSALAFDDTSADTVDAVGSFIDHLETLQAGPGCTPGLNDIDTNADTYDDYYVDVRTGTPVCWRVVSKPNTTVPATAEPQLFHATVDVYGDGVTVLDSRDVYFLVPPAPFDPPVD